MSEPDPTVRGQELGEELRVLREAAELSLVEASDRIDASASKLSRVETGRRSAPLEDVAALLAIYGVTGPKRTELLSLTREVERRGWWQRNRPDFPERQRTLISLESKADHIVNFEPIVIPGLLQTGEYTRAFMHECGYIPPEEIEDRMVARLRRHSILLRERPPHLTTIIDELALQRVVGGNDVLRRQMDHLVEMARRPNISIQVIPNRGAHTGTTGAFALIRQSGGPTVVFTENLTSSLFLEDKTETKTYTDAIRRLSDEGLDARQSTELIASTADQLSTEASEI